MRGPRGTRTVWLVTGIAVGFGAGFVVFERPRAPERAERRAAPEREPAGAPEEAGEPAEARPSDPPPAQPKRATEELVADVDAARDAGDWPAFSMALHALGAANGEAAMRKLLEVMGDVSIDLTEFPGHRFHAWLRDSSLPGIAAAARARYEANVAAGGTSWVGADGWLDLVAEHGTREDLGWLVTLIEKRLHQQSDQAAEALLQARNPAIVEFVPGLLKRPGRLPTGLDAFTANHPGVAFRILDEELAHGRVEQDTLRAYARTVREETLGAAKSRLLSLSEPRARIAAVYAVERLSERGLDISGLDPILRAPIEALTGADATLFGTALYAIEYNERVMWTPQVLDALRGASLTSNEAQRQQLVRMLDARLRSWKGK